MTAIYVCLIVISVLYQHIFIFILYTVLILTKSAAFFNVFPSFVLKLRRSFKDIGGVFPGGLSNMDSGCVV
jgi:hypothetical protein